MKKIITSVLCVSVLSAVCFAGMQSKNPLKADEPKKCFIPTQSVELFPQSFSMRSDLFTKGKGSDAFAEGAVVVTAGYGFPNLGKSFISFLIDASNATDVVPTGFGPLHFRAEYGLSDKIGFAASINYVTYGATWKTTDFYTPSIVYDNKLSFSSISVLGRMNIHFATSDKLDPYWGVGAGYRSGSWSLESSDPDLQDDKEETFSPFGFETTLGMRYYFTDMFGLYIELGIAKSIMQGGLALKF